MRPDYDPIPSLSGAEALEVREANLTKVYRRCNKCGRWHWTDRCHHTCSLCKKHDGDLRRK